MKTKEFRKKLELNKKSISDLNILEKGCVREEKVANTRPQSNFILCIQAEID